MYVYVCRMYACVPLADAYIRRYMGGSHPSGNCYKCVSLLSIYSIYIWVRSVRSALKDWGERIERQGGNRSRALLMLPAVGLTSRG